jgi:drug/metabolite transporter (DMT)-like permease
VTMAKEVSLHQTGAAGGDGSYQYSTFARQQHDPLQQTAPPLDPGDDNHHAHSSCGALWERILSSYVGPRLVLLFCAATYGTNFALGALLDDNLPASAATTGRMTVAAIALSPFLMKLLPSLRPMAVASGAGSAVAYVTQSIALKTTNPARVSFLGACTVLVVPILEAVVDRKPMGLRDAPQTWLAAFLCLAGVGVLEWHHASPSDADDAVDAGSNEMVTADDVLGDLSNTIKDDPSAADKSSTLFLGIQFGDILALIQAIGFGASTFINNKMMRHHEDQALPVTATIITTTAVFAIIWSLFDGWMFLPNALAYTLPGMIIDPTLHAVAGALLWTGLVSTSFNYTLENTAQGRMNPSEASVILASEPLWAAVFASLLYHTALTISDMVGGFLIVAACVVNATLQPKDVLWLCPQSVSLHHHRGRHGVATEDSELQLPLSPTAAAAVRKQPIALDL